VEAMAAVARLRGSPEAAARLMGLGGALREETCAPRWALDQAWHDGESASLRSALGEKAFAAACAAGAGLSPHDAEQMFVPGGAGRPVQIPRS
jgi:hypothetical protein